MTVAGDELRLVERLEALELCSIAVRTFFRSIDDWVRAGMPESDTPHSNRARTAWAELLAVLAAVVRTFGALLRAETAGAATAEEAALADDHDEIDHPHGEAIIQRFG